MEKTDIKYKTVTVEGTEELWQENAEGIALRLTSILKSRDDIHSLLLQVGKPVKLSVEDGLTNAND